MEPRIGSALMKLTNQVTRRIAPTEFTMHTRAERQMLPSRKPARGAATRFACLNFGGIYPGSCGCRLFVD